MKRILLILLLIALPGAAFGLEQSFSQQGVKAAIKLSPDRIEANGTVQLSLKLSKEGTAVTDRDVTLEVYERNAGEPIIKRTVDLLDSDYVDSWKFDKAGDYRMVIKIADPRNSAGAIQYEVNATVMDAGGGHEGHGFFSHHFGGGKWGWWGAGLMLIMMVPMLALAL